MNDRMAYIDDVDDDEIIDIRYYLRVLRTVLFKYYKQLIFLVFMFIIVAVLFVLNQTPRYVATVTLHIAPRDTGVFNLNDYYSYTDDSAFQETQIGLIRSNKLLRRVAEKLSLHRKESLLKGSLSARFRKQLRGLLSYGQDKIDEQPEAEQILIERAAGQLNGTIDITKPSARAWSYLIDLSVTQPEPELAASVANTLAEEYINQTYLNEVESALKGREYLSERLSVLREELREKERQLQQFREAEDIVILSSGNNQIDHELGLVSNELFKAQEKRRELEKIFLQIKDLPNGDPRLRNIPAILSHPLVNTIKQNLFRLEQRKKELGQRYGSRHNKMIALESELISTQLSLDNQIADVVKGIRTDHKLAVDSERSVKVVLDDVRDRKQALGRKAYKLRELENDVESKSAVFTAFLNRLNQDSASGTVRNTNIWVADPATVPRTAVGTSITNAIMLATILGLMFGVGIGILLEIIDDTLKSSEDVESKLGVEALGAWPLIKKKGEEQNFLREAAYSFYLDNQDQSFVEAVKSVRTALILSTLNKNAKRFLVTSCHQAEGKTTVALSLAASIGQTSNTLLIDADLRKPSILRRSGVPHASSFGISDVIAGTAELDDCLSYDSTAKITTLTAGTVTPNALELIGSPQFSQLLDLLNQRYDKIIIDSAPCLAVSDTYLLSTQVDTVVFVVHAATTSVTNVRTVLKRFANLHVPVAGILLNQVDFDSFPGGYGYGGYYRYSAYSEVPANV